MPSRAHRIILRGDNNDFKTFFVEYVYFLLEIIVHFFSRLVLPVMSEDRMVICWTGVFPEVLLPVQREPFYLQMARRVLDVHVLRT